MEDEYLDKVDEALNGVTSKKSEADIFIDKVNSALTGATEKRKALSEDTTYFGGQGFGDSRYDDYTLTEAGFAGYGNDVNEMRAQRQPWIDKAGAGLLKIGTKVLTEVAKMPGMLAGTVAAPFSDNPWETAFNNSWINTIEEWSEHINEEILPVYVKKAVAEGNLWDNVSSIDFWANEGADGIGFIASMLVPGLALSKVGAGSKIIKGLEKAGTKVLGSHEKALQAMQQLGITSKNVDVLNATMANTLFEAGVEAGSAMDHFEQQLTAKLESGEITQEVFDQRIQEKGRLGRDMFVANTGILLIPNLITNKILLGGTPANVAKKSFYKTNSTQLLEEASKTTGKKRVLDYLKEYGKGFLREGFLEEGMQTATENLYGKAALEGRTADYLGEIGSAYLDMVNTTDGQKAIFLGGFLGGPMNVYQKYKKGKAEDARQSNILKAMHNSLGGFSVSLTDIYKKNEDGSYALDKEGKRIKDPIKAQKVAASITQIEDMNEVLEVAEITGNKDLADSVRAQMNSALVLPFITEGEIGIEILKEQLTGMTEIVENVAKYNQAYGTNLTKRGHVNEIVSMAEKMQKNYDRYTTFARDIIDLDNKDASRAEKEDFYNSLQNSYLLTKARKDYMNKYLNALNVERSNLDSEYADLFKNNTEALSEDNIENVKLSKPMYKNVIDKIEQVEKLIDDIQKQEDSFFDNKQANSEFNKLISERKREDAKVENKEEEKVEKAAEDIAKSATEEEVEQVVDNIKKDVSNETKEFIESIAEDKKDQIEDKKVNEASEQINKINSEANEVKKDPFKHGQKIFIEGNQFILNKEGDNEYRIVGLTDWDHPLSGKVMSADKLAELTGTIIAKEEISNTQDNPIESTEGGEITKGMTKKNLLESFNYFNAEGESNTKINQGLPSIDELMQEEFEREHVKVIGTTQQGEKIKFVSDNFIDYLRNGISKIGDTVTFEIGDIYDTKSREAMEAFNAIPSSVDTLDKLTDFAAENPKTFDVLFNLPIKVVTKEGHFSFLTGRPTETSRPLAKQIFSQNELPLRTDIILSALRNGKSFKGITSTIEFQYPGVFQKAPLVDGKVPENNLMDLFHVENAKDVNLYFSANENGDLFNEDKKLSNKVAIKGGSKPGYIYAGVPTANGREFPMKLNVAKINKSEAELIFRLFTEVLSSKQDLSISMTLENLTEVGQSMIKENFKDELALFNKPYEDIKVYELIELFAYSNPNSNYKLLIKDGSLNYGDKRANKNAMHQFKDSITSWLENHKRRHIDAKALAGEKNIDPVKYKEYLITRGILNTDTVVNQPIFQGNTNIYIDKKLGFDKNITQNILSKPEKVVSLEDNKENIEESAESGFGFIQGAMDEMNIDRDVDSIETKC